MLGFKNLGLGVSMCCPKVVCVCVCVCLKVSFTTLKIVGFGGICAVIYFVFVFSIIYLLACFSMSDLVLFF